MNPREFKSKFPLESLVQFDPKTKGETDDLFGHIKAVKFWQSDAVNYSAQYEIEECNTTNRHTVMEMQIKRLFGERTL